MLTSVDRLLGPDSRFHHCCCDLHQTHRRSGVQSPLDEMSFAWASQPSSFLHRPAHFSDLKTLTEYKEKFFPNESEFEILSITFPETELNKTLELIKQTDSQLGEIGIYNNLKNKNVENHKSEFLGYDIIGIEISGYFHSFHCHDLSSNLKEKFGLLINEFGLIENVSDWKKIMEYMNDQENGFEPVPWFYVKVNKIRD